VERLLSDRTLEGNARDLAAKLAGEHGVARAADAIEGALEGPAITRSR
jgi:hypothetical protein